MKFKTKKTLCKTLFDQQAQKKFSSLLLCDEQTSEIRKIFEVC